MSGRSERRYWLTFFGVAGSTFILYGLSISGRPANMTTEARLFLELGFSMWAIVIFVVGLGKSNKRPD